MCEIRKKRKTPIDIKENEVPFFKKLCPVYRHYTAAFFTLWEERWLKKEREGERKRVCLSRAAHLYKQKERKENVTKQ